MIQRDKKHLAAARYEPCIRCGREGETRACHYAGFRQHAYGKGRGIKCSDVAVAYFCQSCDDLFSESSYDKWDDGSKSINRSEQFLHWCMMTLIRRESGATG